MQDIEEFRVATRQWLEAHCPAAMRQPITQEQIVWGGSQVKFSNEDQRVWFERMRDRGWFAPGWPAEFGGGGLTPKQARIVEEEGQTKQKSAVQLPAFNAYALGRDEDDPMHKNLDQLMQAIKKQNQTIERLEDQIKSLKPRANEDLKLAKAFSHKKKASK